jgi:anti-sigma regulatory factor (Ser/Thr protein kinase)
MRYIGRLAQMDTPLKSRPALGPIPRLGARQMTAILGSLTIPGRPEEVSGVRAFITRTLAAASRRRRVDSDAATLLTSELVTNALLHTDSGRPGGGVTVVIRGLPDGILVEVVDDGSAGTPVVKGDALAGEGQGLYLVQQMAAEWGYLRDKAGTTVWFYLAAVPPPGGGPAGPRRGDQCRPAGRARTASSTPSQIVARSSSLVT